VSERRLHFAASTRELVNRIEKVEEGAISELVIAGADHEFKPPKMLTTSMGFTCSRVHEFESAMRKARTTKYITRFEQEESGVEGKQAPSTVKKRQSC
jgi:hypothetical protein